MAKRFTDTNKYKKPFLRGLQGAYKVLWDFLYHDCDNSGIWIVDFDMAQHYVGKDLPINKKVALDSFNTDEIRIVELDNGTKWFIPSFIDFQYNKLSENNKAHSAVISTLKKYDLINKDLSIKKIDKPLASPLQGHKDMDKDKDMVKDKDKSEQEEIKIPLQESTEFKEMTKDDLVLFQSKLIQDTMFIDQLMMTKGIKDKTDMLGWIKYFNIHIIGEEKLNKDFKEYKRHFKNWIVKFDTSVKPPVSGISYAPKQVQDINEMVKKYQNN